MFIAGCSLLPFFSPTAFAHSYNEGLLAKPWPPHKETHKENDIETQPQVVLVLFLNNFLLYSSLVILIWCYYLFSRVGLFI